MSRRISIEALADTVMEYLNDYANVSAEGMKKAVRKAGNTVKKEIGANAPKDTGAYAKSWAVKNTKETANALEVTVYSRTEPLPAKAGRFGVLLKQPKAVSP